MPSLTTCMMPTRQAPGIVDRLRRVISLHFDPELGSAYWVARAREQGIDPRRQVRSIEDLSLLGDMTPADLSRRPLLDYIPRALHRRMDRLIVGQTGGTTGRGTWTAYRDDEFAEAFVMPFVAAARRVRFPGRRPWLFIGPSGPHIIGKVVPHLAAALGSPDAFSVDFDPRWARKLPEGSFGRRRYVAHIIEQAMDVIRTQEVGILFATPAILGPLAESMSLSQRLRIEGVHYGGMAISSERMLQFQNDVFPNALHLSGYGNTLVGCCLELRADAGREIEYFPWGDRLILEVVDDAGLPTRGTGRVRITRLDETFLIVRMVERDIAEALPPPEDGPDGFDSPGVRNPRPVPGLTKQATQGLY